MFDGFVQVTLMVLADWAIAELIFGGNPTEKSKWKLKIDLLMSAEEL